MVLLAISALCLEMVLQRSDVTPETRWNQYSCVYCVVEHLLCVNTVQK